MRAAEALIQQSLLGKQVYELLWQRIVSHQLRPGDKLSDLRLSEELGVSRTPVREALHRLAQEGIVRAESRRGFYVVPLFQPGCARGLRRADRAGSAGRAAGPAPPDAPPTWRPRRPSWMP